MNDDTASKNATMSRRGAGSWISTFQSVMGTRSHKPSFVIVDIGQSGGILLENWFKSHDKIAFQSDILSQAVRFPLMSVYHRIRQSAGEVYGFNVTVEQLRQVQRLADPNQFLQDLGRGGCRVIYLHRRDMLRHAIATLKAYSVNCRFDTESPSVRQGKFTVDVSELLACLKYLDNQRVEASAMLHGIPHLALTYEDDLMDPNNHADTARQVSTFLEVDALEPVGNGLKLVHQQLADIVTNYDAIAKGLAASDYAYLLSSRRHLLTL